MAGKDLSTVIPPSARTVDASVTVNNYKASSQSTAGPNGEPLVTNSKGQIGYMQRNGRTSNFVPIKNATDNNAPVFKTGDSNANLADTKGNTATSDIKSQAQLEQLIIDMPGMPNPLNIYANYTYHVRFSMIDANSAYNVTSKTKLESLNQIIIAESGATVGFNVSKFSIYNTVSPSFKHQNQNLMTWKMTITEPYGLTFPDYVIAAAKQLNISNPSRFPFFIELWFTGYNEDGTIAADKIQHKTWRVMMIDMNLTVGHTGTVYDMNGVADNSLGNTNELSMTAATITLNGVGTVGAAVTKLEDAMNKASASAENKSAGIKYKIDIPNEIKAWKLDLDGKNSQRSGDMTGKNSSKAGNNITVNRGQDVGKFIETLMLKCSQANDYMRGVSGGSSAPSTDKNGLGTVFQIFTKVKLGNYNSTMNDYEKEVTFKVMPFLTPRVVSDPAQAKFQEQLTIQKEKYSFLTSNNPPMLAKRYDYIYTGKNTEILKYDIHVEHFWSISLPSYMGTASYNQYTQGAVVAPNSIGFRQEKGYADALKIAESVTARIKDLDSQLKKLAGSSSSSLSQIAGLTSTISSLGNMANNIQNLSSGNITSMVSQLEGAAKTMGQLATLSAKPIALFDAGSKGTVNSVLNNNSAAIVAQIQEAAKALSSIKTSADKFRGGKYLEDIKTQIESDDDLKVAFMVDPEPKTQNGAFGGSEAKSTQSANATGVTEPAGAGLLGQTMQNMYNQNQMVEIELQIRGDPWWIGMTNLEQNDYVPGNANSNEADFFKGENYLLLSFKTGSNYDESTGFMKFNTQSSFFNGLYSVLEVENNFENGSFTQTLKAYKELFAQKVGKELTPTVTATQSASATAAPSSAKGTPVYDAMGNYTGVTSP